jgi:hypothetical protein
MPYELITTYNNVGTQRWKHKECGKLEVEFKGEKTTTLKKPVKKESEVATIVTPIPKKIIVKEQQITTPTPQKTIKVTKTEKVTYDDLFE